MTDVERNALVTANLPLASWVLTHLYPHLGRDPRIRLLGGWEDALQVARLALVSACRDHDPTRGKLSTVAFTYIKNALRSAIAHAGVVIVPILAHDRPKTRAWAAQARRLLPLVISGNDRWHPPSTHSPEDRELVRELWRAWWQLPVRQRAAVRLQVIEKQTGHASGQTLGCSHETARKLRESGLSCLRTLLKERGL